MKRFLIHALLHPVAWLCYFLPHKDDRVPEIVMRGIDPTFVYKPTFMCIRCGRFRVEGE